MNTETKTGVLIPYLIEMFRFQAWMAMGKVTNPVSGKIERNLDVARQMIDLLGELEDRTEGNRSEDETKLIQGVLTELRLNFMDESKKPPEPTVSAEEAASETDGGAESEPKAESEPEAEPEPEAEREPKAEPEPEEASGVEEQSEEVKQSETESA